MDCFFLFFYYNWGNKHLSSVYLQVVKRKEGLRLSPLFLYVLNAISAGLLRVNNDGIHVFSQHLGHRNLILLLSGLAQVNKTAVLDRGRVRLRKGDIMRRIRPSGNCMMIRVLYHGARVQSFDALHDLSLALLTAVLLPVDSGVTQLLHYLQNQSKWSRWEQGELRNFARNRKCQLSTWLSSMLISSILLLAISTSSVSSSSMRFCSSSDCLRRRTEKKWLWITC